MLKTALWIVLAAVAVILIIAAMRPDRFRIERSIVIKAPPDRIFALVNDLHQWEPWSPWEKIDPALERTYSGSKSGVGAIYEWSGNSQVGQGRMEIVESSPFSKVALDLHFMKPFEAKNKVEFVLTPQTGNPEMTQVTQAMFGPSPFVSKLMGLVFNMDKMVGGKYEEGLANLKALAERS